MLVGRRILFSNISCEFVWVMGQRFLNCRQGAVAVIFGMVLALLGICVGGAVDFARWSSAKSMTASAIDAAVLAGARTLLVTGDTSDAIDVAQSYYEKNVSSRLNVANDSVAFTVTDNGTAVTGSGTVDIGTTFLNLAGIAYLPLVPEGESGFPKAKILGGSGSHMEVPLMLDVTGSMCDDGQGPCSSGTKLDALKSAANDLVDIVVRDDQSVFTTRVAVVPFSTYVRVGPDGGGGDIMKMLTNLESRWNGWMKECTNVISSGGGSESGGTWNCGQYQAIQKSNFKLAPCVTDRHYDNPWVYDYTDDAPGAGKWLNARAGSRMPLSLDSSDTTPTAGVGASSADPMEWWNYDEEGKCWDVDEKNEVLALTSHKSALNGKIEDLVAYGATAGALGTAWSWYMLSPKWSTVFGSASAPRAYSELTQMQSSGAPLTRKVAVLMSDGVFNTYRGWKDADQQQVSNHAKQLCTNMKAQGIEIYAVAFALDQLGATERAIAEDTLRSCGSDLQHFYSTLNAEELQGAFRDIAIRLTTIVLRK